MEKKRACGRYAICRHGRARPDLRLDSHILQEMRRVRKMKRTEIYLQHGPQKYGYESRLYVPE